MSWKLGYTPAEAERSARRQTINDDDRTQWVNNDEGLYRWFVSERMPMREFVRMNRSAIDEVINNVNSGSKPAHYLAYGG